MYTVQQQSPYYCGGITKKKGLNTTGFRIVRREPSFGHSKFEFSENMDDRVVKEKSSNIYPRIPSDSKLLPPKARLDAFLGKNLKDSLRRDRKNETHLKLTESLNAHKSPRAQRSFQNLSSQGTATPLPRPQITYSNPGSFINAVDEGQKKDIQPKRVHTLSPFIPQSIKKKTLSNHFSTIFNKNLPLLKPLSLSFKVNRQHLHKAPEFYVTDLIREIRDADETGQKKATGYLKHFTDCYGNLARSDYFSVDELDTQLPMPPRSSLE